MIPLFRQARVRRGSNVLVTAAAGGVGTAAIQPASFAGATVTAAAGSAEKLGLARSLGASRTIGYDQIADLDDIDVALDPVDGAVCAACLQALRPLGVAIAIGSPAARGSRSTRRGSSAATRARSASISVG